MSQQDEIIHRTKTLGFSSLDPNKTAEIRRFAWKLIAATGRNPA